MPTALITGSNRGLGLEWARQAAARGWRVWATCRHLESAKVLHTLASQYPNLSLHRLDVTSPDEIAELASALQNERLELLVNNAGVYFEHWGQDPIGHIDYESWLETFRVNTLGPIRVTEALRPQLARGSRPLVVAISSNMGSITGITAPRDYAYRSSKAALNAAMRGLALELKPLGIGVLLVHPGWVRTRMGGRAAPITAEESVAGMFALADAYVPEMSGEFLRYDGTPLPW
jgi:NAD(P)-dependent dehydrogenase (short-subunit alcohol dehydrogenase family)